MVKLRVPVCGIDQSGKTVFIAALCDWIVNNNLGAVIEGRSYIEPRIEAFKRGLQMPKTAAGEFHPITIYIHPGVISPLINKPIELQIYDLSGEDYAPPARPSDSGLRWKGPSQKFIENITNASAAITLIDIVRGQNRIIEKKPREAVKRNIFCEFDGETTRYDETTGNFVCQKNPREHAWPDAKTELEFYLPPMHCREDGSIAPFNTLSLTYICERSAHAYAPYSLPPGMINWSPSTLDHAAHQGAHFNGALDVLWANRTFLKRWQQQQIPFALAFSKSDVFWYLPKEKLNSLIDTYFSMAKSRIGRGKYNVFAISSTGNVDIRRSPPQPTGFKELLEYVLINAA